MTSQHVETGLQEHPLTEMTDSTDHTTHFRTTSQNNSVILVSESLTGCHDAAHSTQFTLRPAHLPCWQQPELEATNYDPIQG